MTTVLNSLLADLRYGVRALSRAPLFAAAAVATLALGIGVNTAMFSVLNAELLRPLPFTNPGRLVRVAERNDKLHLPDWATSIPNYLSWKEKSSCFERLGAIGFAGFTLTGVDEPEQLAGNTLTPAFLSLLGLRPVVGREFREDEAKPGSPNVVMIGESLWRRRLAGSPSVIGRRLDLNGQSHEVVGVVPADLSIIATGDIFAPLVLDPDPKFRLNHVITAVARLNAGVSLGQAQTQMESVAAQMGQEHPELKDWNVRLIEFSNWFVPRPLRVQLFVLMGAVVLVLCIACANIASLLLSRTISRRQETAVRLALGASRSDLFRQSLTESLLLAAGGGLAGVALAAIAVRLLNTVLPPDLLPIRGIAIDSVVLLFTASVTVLTSLGFGLTPAWFAARSGLNAILKEGGRGATAGHSRVHRLLVAGEMALATVLLIGAGLLMQTLLHLQKARIGFDSAQLLTFQVALPPVRYHDQVQAWAFYDQLIRGLEAQPGVLSAAVSSGLPFGAGYYTRTPIAPVGTSALPPGQSVPVDWRAVSPNFLRTLKIPLLTGRFFSDGDISTSAMVTVVSRQTATTFWGSENPIGKVIRVVGNGKEFTVVGVAADVANSSLDQAPTPALYFPAAQKLWPPSMDVVLRTKGNPEASVSTARLTLRSLDSSLPLAAVKTMDQWIDASVAQPRLNAALVGLFALTALLMGVIGVYGVLSFSVSQRTREMGLRMALGAAPSDVVTLILSEGMAIAGVGIAAGIAAAAAFSRILTSFLFEVSAGDPAAFLGATLVLAAAAALACSLPAMRASRVDPARVLHD